MQRHLFCGKSLHSCCRCSWARVELVDKQTREFILLHQCYCLLKVFPCLRREATYYICCYGDPRHPKKNHVVIKWITSTAAVLHFIAKTWRDESCSLPWLKLCYTCFQLMYHSVCLIGPGPGPWLSNLVARVFVSYYPSLTAGQRKWRLMSQWTSAYRPQQ